MFRDKNNWIVFILLLGAVFIGMLPAIYNGFPFLNSDSGAYVGFTKIKSTPIDRSIFYSYFIIWLGWKETVELTIVAQSIIGTSLVYLLLRNHFSNIKSAAICFVSILVLGVCTPYSWFISQLCPDIFMAFFALALLGVLWYKPKNKYTKYYYYSIILLSASIHNSILLFCIIYCSVGLLFAVIRKNKYYIQNFAFIFIGVWAVYILASSINYYHHKKFTPNPSGHIFIMSRLAETGILKDVLAEQCTIKNYALCNYPNIEGRQWDFMWIGDYPHNTLGWLDKKVETEYKQIIKATFTNPKHLLAYFKANIIDAVQLLVGTSVNDGLDKFVEHSSPWNNIKGLSENDFTRFTAARQQNDGLPFQYINHFVKLLTWILLFIVSILYFVADIRNRFRHLPFLLFVLSILILNSLITVSLSTYVDRFNARIIWILPFCVFLAFLKAKNYKQQNNYAQPNN